MDMLMQFKEDYDNKHYSSNSFWQFFPLAMWHFDGTGTSDLAIVVLLKKAGVLIGLALLICRRTP